MLQKHGRVRIPCTQDRGAKRWDLEVADGRYKMQDFCRKGGDTASWVQGEKFSVAWHRGLWYDIDFPGL
jgi:hypothetical protein